MNKTNCTTEAPAFAKASAGKLRTRRLRTALLMTNISFLLAFGWIPQTNGASVVQAAEAVAAEYFCPMHPQIRRNQPGLCPICSMQLVPVEAPASGMDASGGTVRLTSRQVQQGGVKTSEVKRRDLFREVDAAGRVEFDERRMARITAWVPGRLDKLYVSYTGQVVSKGEPMAEIYSPELEVSLKALRIEAKRFLAEKDPEGSLGVSEASSYQAARARLLQFGLTEKEVDEYARSDDSTARVPRVKIRAPISGTVVEKSVEAGQFVEKGAELYRVSDLGKVWVVADVYEDELPGVRPGQEVRIRGSGLPAGGLVGTVAFVEPTLNEKTRTARVRVDVANASGLLKPGAYVSAQVHTFLKSSLSIPEAAVLHSGRRHVAFIAEGNGTFRPVEVTLGERWLSSAGEPSRAGSLGFGAAEERFHELLGGLADGARVVSSGTFLLAAESQFQGAMKKMQESDVMQDDVVGGVVAPERMAPAPVADATQPDWMGDYLQVATALSVDDLASARTHAKSLSRPESGVGEPAATRALALAGAGDLEAARKAFQDLSRAAIRRNGVAGGVHLFHCPMVAGYGYWLQKSDKVSNPYLGTAMPTCGKSALVADAR